MTHHFAKSFPRLGTPSVKTFVAECVSGVCGMLTFCSVTIPASSITVYLYAYYQVALDEHWSHKIIFLSSSDDISQ